MSLSDNIVLQELWSLDQTLLESTILLWSPDSRIYPCWKASRTSSRKSQYSDASRILLAREALIWVSNQLLFYSGLVPLTLRLPKVSEGNKGCLAPSPGRQIWQSCQAQALWLPLRLTQLEQVVPLFLKIYWRPPWVESSCTLQEYSSSSVSVLTGLSLHFHQLRRSINQHSRL